MALGRLEHKALGWQRAHGVADVLAAPAAPGRPVCRGHCQGQVPGRAQPGVRSVREPLGFEAVSHKCRRWDWRLDKTFPSFSTRPAHLGSCHSQLDSAVPRLPASAGHVEPVTPGSLQLLSLPHPPAWQCPERCSEEQICGVSPEWCSGRLGSARACPVVESTSAHGGHGE